MAHALLILILLFLISLQAKAQDAFRDFITTPTSFMTFNPNVEWTDRKKQASANENTLFSVKYLIDPGHLEDRKVAFLSCDHGSLKARFQIKKYDYIRAYPQTCEQSKVLNSTQTAFIDGSLNLRREFSALNEFDRLDFKLMRNFNEMFQKVPADYGTFSLQHGHKTKKVFVFVHGFMKTSLYFRKSAESVFYEGHNVILANLPGHENQVVGDNHFVADWLMYIETLAFLARQYGDEVILVGHSLGGNLVLHAADVGLVQKIILIQPMIDVNPLTRLAFELAQRVPSKKSYLIDWIASAGFRKGNKARELFPIIREALKLQRISYLDFPENLKVLVYLSRLDYVVSTRQAQRFFNHVLPQAVVKLHNHDHMSDPEDDFWNDVTVQNFIQSY